MRGRITVGEGAEQVGHVEFAPDYRSRGESERLQLGRIPIRDIQVPLSATESAIWHVADLMRRARPGDIIEITRTEAEGPAFGAMPTFIVTVKSVTEDPA